MVPANAIDSEKEMISTRMLALTGFQQNYEFVHMDEVFLQAVLSPFISLTF